MAEAVAEGARQFSGADLYQVAELIPEESLERIGAEAVRQAFAHIPIAQPEVMANADAIIFGTPTRFGNMAAQMRNFLDQTGQMWAKGTLIGKVASVYGAGTLAGSDGKRAPSENELDIARFQGRHVAEITARLVRP
jgi:NAD(P)H dehydrogenase (quinone)